MNLFHWVLTRAWNSFLVSCPLFRFLGSCKSLVTIISVVSLEWPSFCFTDCTVLIIWVILSIISPSLFAFECFLWNFFVLFLDVPVMSSDVSLSFFLVLDCLLVSSSIFSTDSMTRLGEWLKINTDHIPWVGLVPNSNEISFHEGVWSQEIHSKYSYWSLCTCPPPCRFCCR